jgi:hypothetical protein
MCEEPKKEPKTVKQLIADKVAHIKQKIRNQGMYVDRVSHMQLFGGHLIPQGAREQLDEEGYTVLHVAMDREDIYIIAPPPVEPLPERKLDNAVLVEP